MSIIDKALEANRNYAKNYYPTLGKHPAPKIGDASPTPMRFFSYKDPEVNTREQIKRVRSHPWITKDVSVRGFIFDVDTGRLRGVKVLEHERAA